MRINKIHFIREIVVREPEGNDTLQLQVAYDAPSALHPKFRDVPAHELEEVRALYLEMGGSCLAGLPHVVAIILPNHTHEFSPELFAGRAQGGDKTDDTTRSLRLDPTFPERPLARNRLMGD